MNSVRWRAVIDRTAELSPPTFRTFRRELSSVWRTVSHPRTARNVLEELSSVTERPMIVPVTTTGRPQQRYDHRLRDLVQGTRDVTIATDLGVPRSTAVVRHNAIARPVLRNNSVRRFLTSTKRPNDLNALQKLNLQC